jgi:L-2-hydroxyglutarate oxidase
MVYDYCVVGGGIVGLATAMKLLEMQPGARLVVLEKEAGLSRHQTGHNSGVIHAGIYYTPGSLKADLCRRGSKATKEFCWNHRIPFETCGKLLVATNELELQRMNDLVERAKLNQIEVERLDAADLRQREPNIIGVGGLFVPETGIVDFKRVCEGMAGVVRKAGATIELGVTVTAISESDSAVKISAGGREWQATKLIVCAGLQSDRLARMAGLKTDHQIVPFRGEYYRLPSSKNDIVRHLIYPIPDPDLPFLGVHLTRMMDGSVTVGPNAVLGFAREGYPKFSFNLHDVAEYSTFPGFWKTMLRNIQHGLKEMKNSIFKAGYLEACRKYCPSLEIGDSALRGWHPRPSSDEGRHPRARFFVPGNCPHAPRLQCTVTCRYLRHPDRRNDRGENRWPLRSLLLAGATAKGI